MMKDQRLYWSIGRPIKLLGLTLDEWAVLLFGLVPGIFLVNSQQAIIGIGCILAGGMGCYLFKKMKKLSEHFVLKSYLLAKGWLPAPSNNYPNYLNQRIGK